MDDEEANLIEKFKRLSPGSQAIALAHITAAAELEEAFRQYGHSFAPVVQRRAAPGGLLDYPLENSPL
jgi:hypothetical protein